MDLRWTDDGRECVARFPGGSRGAACNNNDDEFALVVGQPCVLLSEQHDGVAGTPHEMVGQRFGHLYPAGFVQKIWGLTIYNVSSTLDIWTLRKR